ncbi:hypothetical protein ACFWVF_21635 [Streptomyces sp. NPDC058659]|uniref:hypothetical protein n=1 Tax=unclassified Streptomyces TaxID=2593676 RepID=UPI0036636C56
MTWLSVLEVRDMVWRETRRRMGYGEGKGPSTVNGLAPTSAAARRLHLVYMEVATEAGVAARHLVDGAAARAGRAGASYAQLGEAAGDLSRQAARKRWPEAVGTHRVLYTITGKEPPHGRATTLYRSAEKAVERGRTAVDEGALADDGAIAAVVINSAREVVWACWFNDAIWGPEETEQHPALALPGRRLGRAPQMVEEHLPVHGRQLRRDGDRPAPGPG